GWRFTDADHLRAFLVKLTRNRFVDRLRQRHHELEREQPLGDASADGEAVSAEPRPSEVVGADDLWQALLALCPPAHHELLQLKRQGASLTEIAQQTGLHPSSVRRILYDLAQRYAAKQYELVAVADTPAEDAEP